MKLYRSVAVMAGGALLSGCPASAPKPVEPNLVINSVLPPSTVYPKDPNGFVPLVPPRTDFGPSFVFKGTISGATISVESIVCPNLYPSVTPMSAGFLLATASTNSDNSIGFDLSLLEKLIGANTGSLSAKYSGKVSYKVDFKSASDEYFAMNQQFDGATPRTVDPSCHAAIENLKSKGSFTGSLFIVTDAVTLTGLKYTFTQSSSTSASLNVDIAKLLTAKPSASHTFDAANSTVDIAQPLHIAIRRPFLVDTWLPTGAVAAGGARQAVIGAHPINAAISEIRFQ